jgi:hypothetical protein
MRTQRRRVKSVVQANANAADPQIDGFSDTGKIIAGEKPL